MTFSVYQSTPESIMRPSFQTVKASWTFGPATRQLSQVHQQIYNKMALKEKN